MQSSQTLGLIAAGLFWAQAVHAEPLSKQEVKAEKARIQAASLNLRAAINASRTVYIETLVGEAYYLHDRSRLFPLRAPEPVTIEDFSGGPSKVEVKIKSQRLGSGKIAFYPPLGQDLDLPVLQAMLLDAFEFQDSVRSFPALVGNRESRVAHARGANHLPPGDLREPLISLDEAAERGYTPCAICFRPTPLISDYPFEKTLGDACAAQFRQFNPVVPEDLTNQRVRRARERVLSQWLVPGKGYDYHFYVVENDQPNAVACPAGKVFVTTGLLRAVESDEELESVLAHEIAHVERRHGLRQYRRAQTAAVIGGILAVIAGGVTAAKTEDPSKAQSAMELVQIVSGVAGSIALSGYGRREESEADSYALAYATAKSATRSSRPFVTALAKLKYSDTLNGIHGGGLGLFMTHPEIDDRLSKARGAQAAVFFPGTTFAAYDKEGRLMLTLSLDSQAYFEYLDVPEPGSATESTVKPRLVRELQVFASVEATADLRNKVQLPSLHITVAGQEFELDNKEDTEVRPVDAAGMNFVLKDAKGLLVGEVEAVKIQVPGVTRWERVKG